MTSATCCRLAASVLYLPAGSRAEWEFELPADGSPGRMRAGGLAWTPWHALAADVSAELLALCREVRVHPDPGAERPDFPVDGATMSLRLEGSGEEALLEESISLHGWGGEGSPPPASPLLRLVARIRQGPWPASAPSKPAPIGMPLLMPRLGEARGFCDMPYPAWPGRSATGSVILPLPAARTSPPAPGLALEGFALVPKDELHLTLLSTAEAAELAGRLPEPAWHEAFEAQRWLMAPTGMAVLLREEKPDGEEYSVATLVQCPALNAFREALSAASGLPLPATEPHVTLGARPGSRGIGVHSIAHFETLFARELDGQESSDWLAGTVFEVDPVSLFRC